MTHILQQPDYSDYVRNVRESAAVLDRIARNNVIRRDELLFLQSTAMSLADRQGAKLINAVPHVAADTHLDRPLQPDLDDSFLEGLVTWKSLPEGDHKGGHKGDPNWGDVASGPPATFLPRFPPILSIYRAVFANCVILQTILQPSNLFGGCFCSHD